MFEIFTLNAFTENLISWKSFNIITIILSDVFFAKDTFCCVFQLRRLLSKVFLAAQLDLC